MMVPPLEAAPAPAPAPPTPVRLSVAPAPAAQAQAAPAPPAPTPSAPRLSLSAAPAPAAHAKPAPAPTLPAHTPPQPAAGPGPKPYVPSYLRPEEKKSKARTLVTVAIVVVVLGAAAFIAAPLINSAQHKMNEKRKKDTEDFGGGEVGHVMELNRVLDATDPARFEKGAGEPRLTAPTWSLDVTKASIPSGTVRGKITNMGFILDDASLEVNGGRLYVLSLRHGLNAIADREVLISLRLNQGEDIQGKSWNITKETTTGAPGVAKKWRTDLNLPPKQVGYTGGYALKLEFEKAVQGIIPGKIYLALPDQEESVIAGEFHADIRVPTAAGSKQTRRLRFSDE